MAEICRIRPSSGTRGSADTGDSKLRGFWGKLGFLRSVFFFSVAMELTIKFVRNES
jgi:hypothetical protein